MGNNKPPQKTKEELSQTSQGRNSDDLVGAASGPRASLRQRITTMLTVPTRWWAAFTGRVKTVWRFVTVNKMRLFLTIVLIATIIGAIGAAYLWRREIADFIAWAIDRIITRIRGGRFSQSSEPVIIGQSVGTNGIERTVFRVRDSGEF